MLKNLAALKEKHIAKEESSIGFLGFKCHHLSMYRDAQQVTAGVPESPCNCLIAALGRDPGHLAITGREKKEMLRTGF